MGKFYINKTKMGFNFSLLATNKEKIAVSSQVYATKASCKKGCESVTKFAVKCIAENKIEDQTLVKGTTKLTNPKFEIYLDKAGLFRYRLYASNGESICMSEGGYKSKSGCLNGIKSVATNSQNAEYVDETADK